MKRRLFKPVPRAARKVLCDEGTSNEQTITTPYQRTYFDIVCTKLFWFLSEHMRVKELPWPREQLHRGYGFYMSGPWADRVYWVWGKTKWTMFWGPRMKNEDEIVEFIRYK